MANLFQVVQRIVTHPLNQHQRLTALSRFFKWQIGSRIMNMPIIMEYVGDSKLIVRNGMTAATGNLYCGLFEFEEMAFLLHFLTTQDRFVDIGANVGTYTILASRVCKAHSIAVEPVPLTFTHLSNNVRVNGLEEKVELLNIGCARTNQTMMFTVDLDAKNHIVIEQDSLGELVTVPVQTLDDICMGFQPNLLKIDVEGFESEVIGGGKKTLSNPSLQAIIIELNGNGGQYGYKDNVISDEIISHGFTPCMYRPFSRSLEQLSSKNRYSNNTIYVREIDLVQQKLQDAPSVHVHGIEL